MAGKRISIVYGGASCGLMGALSDAALLSGGVVVGVMLKVWEKEIGHSGLSRMHIVNDMFERKKKYVELSDSYIALPGGGGTLDEFFEVFTLKQIGAISSPIGLLNVDGYYDDLIRFIKVAVSNNFIKAKDFNSIIIESEVEMLIERMIKAN